MRIDRPLLYLLSLMLFLASCFKEDDPIAPHQAGDVQTDTIPMTTNYLYQVYYNLETGSIVSKNERTNSDLGFECSTDGWRILLNTANFMKVADLGKVPFGQAQDTTGATWIFDKSDGNPDSLGIGKWFTVSGEDTVSNGHVYLINRGMDPGGNYIGFVQVIFDSLSNGVYSFRFADIKGGNVYSWGIPKVPSVNFRWFSFHSTGLILVNEPPKTDYDLLFTSYTTMLYTDIGEPYPYLVTGVLTNRDIVQCTMDTTHSFSSITLAEAMQLELTTAWDKIGYDWKYYSFETGAYTMRDGMVYIVRSVSGVYFKLRFIGFYNTKGEKGYPVIEYQAL